MTNPTENRKMITFRKSKKKQNATRSRKISETANAGHGFFRKSKRSRISSKLLAEQKLKANKEKMDEFLNSTFNVSKSGINSEFNAFYKEKKTALSKPSLMKTTKVFWEAESDFDCWKTSSSATENKQRFYSLWTNFRIFNAKG
jgi:hypothetical protein